MLGEPEVRRIVARAIDDSRVVRFWVAVCGAIAGAFAGYYFATRAADPAFDSWLGGLVLAGIVVIVSLASDRLAHVLIVRKIEALGSGNRCQ